MMNGEIWGVNFEEPYGSEPGFRRPAVIIQKVQIFQKIQLPLEL